MGHGREEVTERFERHVANGAEVLAGAHEPLFDGEVLRRSSTDNATPTKATRAARAHSVGNGLFEPVAVADPAEVGEQQLGHRVVAAFERRGQPEPLVVLLAATAAAGLAAHPVAFVGDEQTAGFSRAVRACTGGGVRRRHEHVTGAGHVPTAVAQSPDARVRQHGPETAVPLLHEHA